MSGHLARTAPATHIHHAGAPREIALKRAREAAAPHDGMRALSADEGGLAQFGASSKLNTDPRLLTTLFGLGRAAADGWLTTCAKHVGHESTLDIGEVFLANRVRNARPAIKPPSKKVDKTANKTVDKAVGKLMGKPGKT